MKKVFLVAHRDERDAVTEVLQRLGVLQVEDILSLTEVEEAGLVERDEPGAKAGEIDAQLAELRFSLDFIQRIAPEKTTFIQQFAGTKVFLKEQEFNHYLQNTAEVALTEQALRAADEELNRSKPKRPRITLGSFRTVLDLRCTAGGAGRRLRVAIGGVLPLGV